MSNHMSGKAGIIINLSLDMVIEIVIVITNSIFQYREK